MITVAEAFAKAFALDGAGRRDAAGSIYRQILAAMPEHPGALLRLALHDLADGRPAAAREQLVQALAAADRQGLPAGDVWLALGRAEAALHDASAADAAFARVLELAPDDFSALMAYGQFLVSGHRPEAAETVFRRAIAGDPGRAPAHSNLALALAAQLRWAEAGDAARYAIAIADAEAHAFQVAAYVAQKGGNAVEAVAVAREGLRRFPADHDLVLRCVEALTAARRAPEACRLLEAVLRRSPDDMAFRASLGAVQLQLGAPARAAGQLRQATRAGDAPATTWDNLGLAERALGDCDAAISAFESALRADPLLTTAATNLVKTQQEACAWDAVEAGWARLQALLSAPGADPRYNPFVALGLPTSPGQQLAIARKWSRHTLPPVAPALVRARGDRLRVGYVSGDLHGHATAYLMAGLFECHDRGRFDVRVYSHGPDDGSAVRGRIRAAVDGWVDVSAVDDATAAAQMRADGLDVLVDLKGHTQDARLGIAARRPAPCQLHYLGYPGTLGSDAIDGIVADDIVVPAADAAHFHERVLRLPRCYQVNDRKRALPDPTPRPALGFPDAAVVLSCFNQSCKLTRAFFDIWLDTLREVPGTLLWLFVPLPLARRNLLQAAERAGIAASRIVFADRADPTMHIARLRAADLALDLLPYGSHTTGSDALWAGVPMLTCRGTSFAGRVGASLLDAVGLNELVTETPMAYRSALIALAADRDRLRGYRDYLDRERMRLPLFDTPAFTRDWERLLVAASDAASPQPS